MSNSRARLRVLSPEAFERLVTRLLWRWGFYNVQRLGGSGDRGRDITAQTAEYPLPGRQLVRKWVVQCKHWSAAPSKTHLREGFDTASAHDMDYYLLVGTFDMTPHLADWIDGIRVRYPFDILVVCGDELEGWLASSPDITYDFLGDHSQSYPYTALMQSLIAELGPTVQPGPDFLATMSLTMSICRVMGSPIVSSLHMLLAMNLRRASIGNSVLERCGLTTGSLRRLFPHKESVISSDHLAQEPQASPNVIRALREAGALASSREHPKLVGDIDLLAAMVRRHKSMAVQILRVARVDFDHLCAEVASVQRSAHGVLQTPDLWNLSLGTELRNRAGKQIDWSHTEVDT